MRVGILAGTLALAILSVVEGLVAASAQDLTTAQLQALGQQDAAAAGVPWSIFQAQIQGESSWNPNIGCNSKGACGIAQFMPGTAAQFGIDPSNPQQSLQAAAQYDAQLYKQDGSWTAALTGYSGGLTPTNPKSYAAAFDAAQGADSGSAAVSTAGDGLIAVPTYSEAPVAEGGTGTCTVTNATAPAGGGLTNGSLDQMVGNFQTLAGGWTSAFLTAAQGLFWLLFLIEAGYSAFGIVMQPEMHGDWIGWIIRQVLAVTFWQFLVTNAVTWMTDIVSGFQWLAGQAGTPYTTPSTIFTEGVNLSSYVMCQTSLLHPINSTGLILVAILILLCFVWIAELLIEVLAETWFITGMAALFMAFGGMRFSRDIAISCIRHSVGVGFKLLALTLLVGAGANFLQKWAGQINTMTFQQLFVMLGSTFVISIIAKRIPDRVQAVALGSPGSWGAETRLLREAVGAAAMAAAPALAVAGLGGLATAAARYGQQELTRRDGDGSAPQSAGARAGVVASTAGRAIAGAASAEIGNRLGGRYRAGGMATVRMAQNINNQRRLNEANNPPQGNP